MVLKELNGMPLPKAMSGWLEQPEYNETHSYNHNIPWQPRIDELAGSNEVW